LLEKENQEEAISRKVFFEESTSSETLHKISKFFFEKEKVHQLRNEMKKMLLMGVSC
jgi:hypothetical protein